MLNSKVVAWLLLLMVNHGQSREGQCSPQDALSIWNNMPLCIPRETIVEVPRILDPALFQIVPQFVSVQRCSGTCHQGNQYHNCIPTRTNVVNKQIMIQRLNSTGHIQSTCSEVAMEEHEACACGCRISEGDCKSNQYFSANLCRCECNDRAAMNECFRSDEGRGIKIWDTKNCMCRCAESFRECSTGYIYDQTDTCSCVPELRPASTVPIVALVVALIGTLTCLILVMINYRRTRKVLMRIQRENRLNRLASTNEQEAEAMTTPTNDDGPDDLAERKKKASLFNFSR